MPIVALQSVSFDHGGPLLLDQVDLAIEAGERLALVGRNGTGKSTLLALLAGELVPGDGRLTRTRGVRVRKLDQLPGTTDSGTVRDLVTTNARQAGREERIERLKIDAALERLGLDGSRDLATLSAGTLRRAWLAALIAAEPDLLLLDEPTNHLDIDAIRAVEALVREYSGAVVFVSHDRRFIETVATGIVELDRGRLRRYPGAWETYVDRRNAALDAEERSNAEFDKVLAREEVWLRRGVKARRARNMGRVRELRELRVVRHERRERLGQVDLKIQAAEPSGRLVIRTAGLTFAWGDRPVVDRLDLDLMRGDRLGIVGPNGCGKSTLVKVLLAELAPTAGTVRHGTNLGIGFFDQHQEQLDPKSRVQDAVAGGATAVEVGGGNRHVISYLADFLFTPDQCRGSVERLSGGERNRLLLARLLARKTNLLVLDEPTNDLDIETSELLENVLSEIDGTLLLVSHDRTFLDNVVTGVLVHEGDGRWKEYDGGYGDYERVRSAAASPPSAARPTTAPAEADAAKNRPKRPRLGNRERLELAELPGRIEALEAELNKVHADMADPAFFKAEGPRIAAAKARLEALPGDLARAYARWTELLVLE